MKLHTRILPYASLAAVLLAPASALAHPGHGTDTGLWAGVLHPLTGMDHLLALLSTGILAGRMRTVAGVAIGSAFLLLLATGIVCGFAGTRFGGNEAILGLSVVTAMALAAWPPRRLGIIVSAFAAMFAFFHGLAYGEEAAANISHLRYATGLLLSSASLLAIGALIGRAIGQRDSPASRPAVHGGR